MLSYLLITYLLHCFGTDITRLYFSFPNIWPNLTFLVFFFFNLTWPAGPWKILCDMTQLFCVTSNDCVWVSCPSVTWLWWTGDLWSVDSEGERQGGSGDRDRWRWHPHHPRRESRRRPYWHQGVQERQVRERQVRGLTWLKGGGLLRKDHGYGVTGEAGTAG